jgi:two-component system chemotaxis response regulator CheY
MRILIVDDSSVMRRIHRNVLKENNIDDGSVIEADNGEDALKLAMRDTIGLFLVDWNIPGLNGLEFVKRIRSVDKYFETPIIMISSEAADYSVNQALEAGATSYIVKPVKADLLWKKIAPFCQS